jgi:hypothetical protein
MRDDLFMFLRGTFYRWAQLWPEVDADLRRAPKVVAVGDLHVNSFGTWRDSEGRMAWGVDDFDDSYPLPYTNDLVRLAASVKIVSDLGHLSVGLKNSCEIILQGYRKTLRDGGCPIVLAERETNLELLGLEAIKPADHFWEKLNHRPVVRDGIPKDAHDALKKTLPRPNLKHKIVLRKAGEGSLGQQRYVAIADWEGGFIAREAKAMIPSSCVWLNGHSTNSNPNYERAIQLAVRAHDPFQRVVGRWLLRRLSPDSNPLDIAQLPKAREEENLLHAMGKETANVHLGTSQQRSNILKHLGRLKANWLHSSAKRMAKVMEKEWKEYRK